MIFKIFEYFPDDVIKQELSGEHNALPSEAASQIVVLLNKSRLKEVIK
jgi:hypothetical protein